MVTIEVVLVAALAFGLAVVITLGLLTLTWLNASRQHRDDARAMEREARVRRTDVRR